MENATKALEMAAGVLIALMIIGVCVYAYNNLSEQKNIEQSSTRAQQAADFNKSYEVYNQDSLYGSEVLSLANKVVDYNKNEAIKKGYGTMTIEVKRTEATSATLYFKNGTYNQSDLTTEYENLSDEIKNADTKENGKYISEWAKMASTAIPSDVSDKVNMYKNLLNDQTDMARAIFECTNVTYNKQTGRIEKMIFKEKSP